MAREAARPGESGHMTDCSVSSPAAGGDLILVGDCTTLLKVKDILDPSDGAQLNWSVNRSMTTWDGVVVSEGRVISLGLNNFNLTASIPSRLDSLTDLTILRLSHSNLGGTIPPELGALPNLRILDLGGNNLTGSIPWELGALSLLQIFYLSENNLTGCIPEAVARLGERIGSGYSPNPQRGGDLPVCEHTIVLSLPKMG